MAMGMELLLKSLGIDPSKIEELVKPHVTQAVEFGNNLKAQLDRIEGNQHIILNWMNSLSVEQEINTVPAGPDGLMIIPSEHFGEHDKAN